MNLSCPICSRETEVERDIGDFLTRCNRCGNLVRFPAQAKPKPAAKETPARKLERAPENAVATPAMTPVVLPEAREEMERIRARRRALAHAARKGRHEAMGTLGWIGLGVAAVLAVIAISVKAQNLMGPSSASAQSMVMR